MIPKGSEEIRIGTQAPLNPKPETLNPKTLRF